MVSKRPLAVVVGKRSSEFSDENRRAFRLGVGPGLGASLARRFAAGGYAIGLVSRRETSLQPVQKQLEEKGHTGE